MLSVLPVAHWFSHRDLICPGCLPYLGAFLTPSFHSAQCFLHASMRWLVLALCLKENVFCMMVRCAVCEWVCARHGVCSCKCRSSPSTLLQVGSSHFFLFTAVDTRLAGPRASEESSDSALCLAIGIGIAGAHSCSWLSMGPHSHTASI